VRKQLPPIKSESLTNQANRQGIRGTILIIKHHYFLNVAGERRRIGFTRIQAEDFIMRKASRLPIQNLEVTEPEEKALPDQIDLITGPGQLSLI